MGITKEDADMMRNRVKHLATLHNKHGEELNDKKEGMLKAFSEAGANAAKRTESRSNEPDPKTAPSVGAMGERETGAARAQPQRKKNPEYNIQKDFVQEMGRKHPSILVFSDAAAHVAKSMIQQVRANALQSRGQKWPDCFIAQPSGDYAGLFLEFKAQTPYKADGVTLLKSDHVEAQAATMERLRERGYQCWFVWTSDFAIEIVEKYLNGKL